LKDISPAAYARANSLPPNRKCAGKERMIGQMQRKVQCFGVTLPNAVLARNNTGTMQLVHFCFREHSHICPNSCASCEMRTLWNKINHVVTVGCVKTLGLEFCREIEVWCLPNFLFWRTRGRIHHHSPRNQKNHTVQRLSHVGSNLCCPRAWTFHWYLLWTTLIGWLDFAME
jgi:hypothetical protein